MSSEKPTFLLVDGNNIIHAWKTLSDLHRKRKGLAHAELIRQLQDYRAFSDHRVVLVFDGRDNRKNEERDSIQIIYTEGGQTADEVIERLAAIYAEKYRIIVATDDRLEQDLVVSAGGEVMSSEMLQRVIDDSADEMARFLNQRRR